MADAENPLPKYLKLSDEDWITEVVIRGVKCLIFPSTKVSRHGWSSKTNIAQLPLLRLAINGAINTEDKDFEPHLITKHVNHCESSGGIMPRPILSLPFHHSEEETVPVPLIASKICQRLTRWGEEIRCRGDIQYLSGFREWMKVVQEKLYEEKKTKWLS